MPKGPITWTEDDAMAEIERLTVIIEDKDERLANMQAVVDSNIESGKRIRVENAKLQAFVDAAKDYITYGPLHANMGQDIAHNRLSKALAALEDE